MKTGPSNRENVGEAEEEDTQPGDKIVRKKRDMESVGLKRGEVLDRTKWKNGIHNDSGDHG